MSTTSSRGCTSKMLTRLIAMVTAFGLGWIIYMIGMLLTVYDGVLSLIFQPVMGRKLESAS